MITLHSHPFLTIANEKLNTTGMTKGRYLRVLTKPGPDRIRLTKPGPDRTGLTKPGSDCVRLTKPGPDPKKVGSS